MSPKLLEDVRTGDGLTLASLTIDQFHQMIRNGILAEDEPIELIRGVLAFKDRRDTSNGVNTPSEFRKKLQGVRHSSVVSQLGEILTLKCVPLGCHPRIQLPLPLPPFDEPEPDLCVVRGRAGDYRERHPDHRDVLVVIEVAGSSLACDQKMKQRLYAASKIPVYIIVNLQDETIIAYSQPVSEEQKYDQQTQYRRGEIMELSLSELGQVLLSVDEVL